MTTLEIKNEAKLFEDMHPSTHKKLVEQIKKTQASHVILTETQEITSATVSTVAVMVGPTCTITSIEGLTPQSVIDTNGTCSGRRVPTYAVKVETPEKFAKEWNDPRILPESEKNLPAIDPTQEQIRLATSVAQWLKVQGKEINDIYPVVVTLDTAVANKKVKNPTPIWTSFVGAHYTQNNQTKFYLLGSYPEKIQDHNWQMSGNTHDFYLGGYIKEIKTEYKDFHPFGPNLMLCEWNQKGFVDDFETQANVRKTFSVTKV
jgi:hypothetical protein